MKSPNVQHHLIGDQPLFHEVEDKKVSHFLDDEPSLLMRIGLLQHLPRAETLDDGV